MSFAQQVKNYLDWIEGLDWNFNEQSVPVGHRTVPEARSFKGAELAALETLGAYQAGLLVNVVEEIEFFALVVLEAADQVNRIEVGG